MNLNKNIQIFKGVRLVDKLMFTKHLAVMLKSGVPISESIAMLEAQTESVQWKGILAGLGTAVRNGQTLQKALAKYPDVFEPLYVHIVEVGESSGNLQENLAYLERSLAKSYEFKKRIQGAMVYPALIIFTAIIVGGGLSVFVLPQLVDLFKSLDVTLPLSTRVLLWFAGVMKQWGVLIMILVVAGVVGFMMAIKTAKFKPVWHAVKLRIPVWGKLSRDITLAAFCRNLGMMLSSGVVIENAMKITADASDNLVFTKYGKKLATAVEKGKTLEKELASGDYPFFPKMIAKMVGVGERTGKLPETLLYLADFWESEVDERAKSLMTVIEPVLLVIIAGVVAFLAMAIISPIYQFTAAVRR